MNVITKSAGLAATVANLFPATTKDGVYFYPKDNLTLLLKLSATEEFSSSSQYSVSTLPTVDTLTVTDAITRQPKKISIKGVLVPSVVGLGVNVAVSDFIEAVELWRKQRQVITVSLPDGMTLQQTFITSFDASRDKTNSKGFNISIEFEEIMSFPQRLGKGVAIIKASDSQASSGQPTTKKGSVTSKVEKGQLSTTEGSSRKACDAVLAIENTYKGQRSDIWNAMSKCKSAQLSSSSPVDKVSAEEAARQVYKVNGANPNKNKGAANGLHN